VLLGNPRASVVSGQKLCDIQDLYHIAPYLQTVMIVMGSFGFSSIHLVPYIEDMPSLISSCDLSVSRVGATTLAEITALGAASLIIPSPYVVANHQEYNAKELVNQNAARWILEKDLNADCFVKIVRELLAHKEC